MKLFTHRILCASISLGILSSAAFADHDSRYKVTNLVSDVAGLAPIIDPNLINPWGIGLNATGGAVWISNQGSDTSTLYTGDVNGSPVVRNALVVAITGGSPTGQVFNPTPDFAVTNGTTTARALFIFASLNGHISGWNPTVAPNTTSKIGISVSGAVYTGLAIGNDGARNLLYAANFRDGTIDVFDSTYAPTGVPGMFNDPHMHLLRPFNIQALGGKLYVTYTHPLFGFLPGLNAVNEFDMRGNLLRRIVRDSHLSMPWGVAIAPADFGSFSNALLVGNFQGGEINAFRLSDGKRLGELKKNRGGHIRIDNLWALQFGNGVSFGNKNSLYFTAGIRGLQHGLIGKVEVDN